MLLFSGIVKRDFIDVKYRFNLQELVQVHHIIPLQWKSHANLYNYDVHSGNNLIFLPTKKGKEILKTNRRIHDGGHPKYNLFIKEQLDLECDPYELSRILRNSFKYNQEIPW